jgi:hypothetical protein
MSDPVRDRFERVKDVQDDSDWRDVRRRAYGRRRMVTALVAAGAVLVVLLVAPGIGLGGRIIGLFTGPGKPVPLSQLTEDDRRMLLLSFCQRVELVTPDGRAPELRCAAGGTPMVTKIADDGKRAYWKAVYPDGHVCLASGSSVIRRSRVFGDSQFGSTQCTEGQAAAWLVPSPEHPITSQVAMSGSPRTGEMRIFSVSGLAGDGITRVGILDEAGHAATAEVEGHVYLIEEPPARDWVTLFAYGRDGNVVYRESLTNPPHPPNSPRKPLRPVPQGSPRKLVQHAEAGGASIDVYESGRVVVDFAATSQAYDFLRAHLGGSDEITVECGRAAFGAGRWLATGNGVYDHFGRRIETTIPVAQGMLPPFDVCSVRGHYGRRWDENIGYHNAVEFAFNPLAKRFFAEQAAARRVAYFVRSPKMHQIRAGLKAGGIAPSSSEIASHFDESVVALPGRDAMPPAGKVGVWSDGSSTIVAAERADDGRRMWVELDRGRLGPHDLHGLAFVF